jgi:flavoprotein
MVRRARVGGVVEYHPGAENHVYVDPCDRKLTTVEVPRDDVQARVDHYARVSAAGCDDHEAIIQNGAITLVMCTRCVAPQA